MLAIALSISPDPEAAASQLGHIENRIGDERGQIIKRFWELNTRAGEAFRLPLLEIAFPSLRSRPRPQIEFLLETVQELIQLDGRTDMSEFCFFRILKDQLEQSQNPERSLSGNRVGKKTAQQAAVDLAWLIAQHGHPDAGSAESAFDAARGSFGPWSQKFTPTESTNELKLLNGSLDTLARLNPAGKRSLLKAVTAAATWDRAVTLREAELLRTVCAALRLPLPPIVEFSDLSMN